MRDKLKLFFTQGQERSLKAKRNILGMFFLKGLSIFISLLIVPLTINYVSPYQYGIWLTISSLVAWLSFFDIGLGNGLKNKFIEAISRGKIKLAKIYISTTYAILAIIVFLVWCVFSIVVFYVNWAAVLNTSLEMAQELTYVILIMLTNFCCQFVLRLISTLVNSIQKPFLASLFDTVSQIILALFILYLTKYTEGSLIYLAIALGIAQISVLILASFWFYTHELFLYRPSIRFVRFRMAKGLLSLGAKFFFLQIISIIIYESNNIIITQLLGPSEVSVYNIAYKYLFTITMLFNIILTPFWSAFVEAHALDDYNWMKNVTKKLRIAFLLIAVAGVVMTLISPIVYKMWLGNTIYIPFIITFLMLIYHITNTWGGLHSQLLAGLGKVKLQLFFSSICGIINIPLTVCLCKLWGLPGLILGNIIVFLLFNSWFGFIQVNRILSKKAEGVWNE